MRHFLSALLPVALIAGSAVHVRGALPPRQGGQLGLPSPEPVRAIDPARAFTAFEATLVQAVFDGLYEIRSHGDVVPVLAESPPEVDRGLARIRLRSDVRHHGGGLLRARHVVRSLSRVASVPENAWLLGAFATENGNPVIRELDERTIEIELAHPDVPVDVVLASAPFAVVVGGNLRRQPLGTGPFWARLDGRGGVELGLHPFAADRPPWLDQVRFHAPVAREEEIRSFELGRLDGSWHGRSLYGGEPVRPVRTTATTAATPILLVPNRTRALREDSVWGGVVAAIDRRRLERVGLAPRRTLGDGLPAPALPRATPTRGLSLSMIVRRSVARELRLAEALAGMLDERGVRLQVELLSDARYESTVNRGHWDLRIVAVRPPMPGQGALAGAALAAAGQVDHARTLGSALGDSAAVARAARRLDAMVLGHERIVLHHRADLAGLRFDSLGRLALSEVSFARTQEPFR